MSERSVTVTSLSGRTQGLKFMQRGAAATAAAAASAGGGQSSASSSSNPPMSSSTANTTKAGQTTKVLPSASQNASAQRVVDVAGSSASEQWSMPASSSSPVASTSRLPERFVHQDGWDAWHLNASSERPEYDDSAEYEGTASNAAPLRRRFGAWEKKRAKEGDNETNAEGVDQEGAEEEGWDGDDTHSIEEASSVRSSAKVKAQGFIKPGSLSSPRPPEHATSSSSFDASTGSGARRSNGSKNSDVLLSGARKRPSSSPSSTSSSRRGGEARHGSSAIKPKDHVFAAQQAERQAAAARKRAKLGSGPQARAREKAGFIVPEGADDEKWFAGSRDLKWGT